MTSFSESKNLDGHVHTSPIRYKVIFAFAEQLIFKAREFLQKDRAYHRVATSSTEDSSISDVSERSGVEDSNLADSVEDRAEKKAWEPFAHNTSSFNKSIEGLRGVAVTCTVLSHVLPLTFPNYYFLGDAGVDIFFVLSGFLMTRILLSRQADATGWRLYNHLPRFYLDRIVRLTPPLIFMLVCMSALRISRGEDVRWSQKFAILAICYVTNIGTIRNGPWGPFANTWSLAVEEQFYIIWAILLPLVEKLRYRSRFLIMFLLIFGSCIIRIRASFYDDITFGEWYIGGPSHFFRMFAGTLLHLLPMPLFLRHQRTAYLGLFVLVFNTAIALGYKTEHKLSGVTLTPFTLLGTLLIIAGTEEEGNGLWLLEGRIIRFLGKISYAWYLWQYPLLVANGWSRTLSGWEDTATTLCAAMFSSFVIEDSVRKYYHAYWAKKRAACSLPR